MFNILMWSIFIIDFKYLGMLLLKNKNHNQLDKKLNDSNELFTWTFQTHHIQ